LSTYTFDCEVFSNYFCVYFYDGKTFFKFTHANLGELVPFLHDKTKVIVGFNNWHYDNLILLSICKNPRISTVEIFNLSKRIIGSANLPRDLFQLQYSDPPWHHSVDIFQVLNKKGALKLWECHIHFPTVVDSPVNFDAPLPDDKVEETQAYCRNDVLATHALYEKNLEKIELRRRLIDLYELDNRPYVSGDAGIAQQIAMHHYTRRTGSYSKQAKADADASTDNKVREWLATNIVSESVHYITPEMQDFLEMFKGTHLKGNEDGTQWTFDRQGENPWEKPIHRFGVDLQLGVGGLHSVDGPGRFVANDEVGIYDLDVASFYPSLMINLNLFPSHMGPEFIDEFEKIRDMRLKAKRSGDKPTAEALKIVLNSTFGKFNDKYSPIRSIPSALRVTLNGQLQLMMLMERLWLNDFRILSANTDGCTFMMLRSDVNKLNEVISTWQNDTGHELELTEYKAYVRRDVNNYLALKTDGKVKTKGAFEEHPLGGKTDERIVKEAASNWLLHGVPIRQTVEECSDITAFIYYTRIGNGGTAYSDGVEVGRTVRWYVSTSGVTLQRKNPDGSFDTLPNGRNAVLTMTLPDAVPADLDRDYYITEAVKLVNSITARSEPKKPRAKKATNV